MDDHTIMQFDDRLGGNVDVPNSVSVKEFAEHRMEEILMLTEALNEPPYKGQIFQRLPKHMRRRQMSHYTSRLPRKLRALVEEQKNGSNTKRPSRKHRRKPTNLLADYNRRKRRVPWLETHIWHAKRFHMVERWGYKLPESSTNKSFRANYRAIRSHCLIIDMSYLGCIEVTGEEGIILQGLSKCTRTENGRTFSSKMTLSGAREGHVTVYHAEKNPTKVIGSVTFLWRPVVTGKARTLWIWSHPLVYQELTDCLVAVFELQKDEEKSLPTWLSSNSTTKLTLLKDTLNRYRLIGSLASSVLADALPAAPKPATLEVMDLYGSQSVILLDDEEMKTSDDTSVQSMTYSERKRNMATKLEPAKGVLGTAFSEDSIMEAWNAQKAMLEKLKSVPPDQFPNGAVLGALVSDPRMFSPDMRTKSNSTVAAGNVVEWNDQLPVSSLWQEDVRKAVTESKPSDFEVNQLRSANVVPPTCEMHPTATVPTMLIQQSGCDHHTNLGFGAGWDIITPSGWGLPIWRSLILRGARVGGLRESRLIALEMASLKHALPPDSEAGAAELRDREMTLRNKYFRLPPAKRPNYIKLGVYKPFTVPWDQIVAEPISIVRDQALLFKLHEGVTNSKSVDLGTDKNLNVLVPIRLRCLRGRPENLARIYLPSKEDFLSDKRLLEPNHEDTKATSRTEKRKERLKTLRSWRKSRKLEKPSKMDKEEVAKIRGEWKEAEENAWLLDRPVANIREVVGCVLTADFKFSEGCGAGIGYVTLAAILQSIEDGKAVKKKPMMLLRNIHENIFLKSEYYIIME